MVNLSLVYHEILSLKRIHDDDHYHSSLQDGNLISANNAVITDVDSYGPADSLNS
ncbi:1181_t:CDS:2, partial [Gigaspora rosea]